MTYLDWNLARAFSFTAELGSLSAAARKLGLTQPTLSRQVAALEGALGVTLFERVGKRLVLTESGLALRPHARAIAEAVDGMALAAAGKAQAIEGRVSISASDAFAAYLLPDILARIREAAPQVTLVIIATNALSDLRRREADIAIRHVRPGDGELICQLVHESTAHFYAAESFIARSGQPGSLAELTAADLLGFEPVDRFADQLQAAGIPVTADAFRIVSENGVAMWEMVRRGLGIGVMLREIAERTAGIAQVMPQLPGWPVPIWLVTHRELRTSRRVRLVYDLIAEEIRRLAA
jgi:DNA-binding transcriptional LysR family regulator